MVTLMQHESQKDTQKKHSSKVSLFGDLTEYPEDPVEAAHILYHLGFSVIPFHIYRAGGKTRKMPMIKNWKPYKATWEEVEKSVAKSQAFAIVVPSGFMVIDLDCDDADEITKFVGLDRLIELSEKYSNSLNFLDTITCNTPTGGIHLWFRIPPGLVLKNSTGVIAPKVDLRVPVDGLVIMPPSRGITGNYSFDNHFAACFGSRSPRWLINEIKAGKKKEAEKFRGESFVFDGSQARAKDFLESKAIHIRTATEGNRNHVLNAVAYGIYKRVYSGDVPIEAAEEYIYDAAADAGLDHREIVTTMGSAKRAVGL